jgi:hypothetical protein
MSYDNWSLVSQDLPLLSLFICETRPTFGPIVVMVTQKHIAHIILKPLWWNLLQFLVIYIVLGSLCCTSKSAPARTADRRSQFFRFPCFMVATLRLTLAMLLPSNMASRRLTPSMLALDPAGSSKSHFLSEAFSRLAHSILTPKSCAPSSVARDRSARSRLQEDRFATDKLQPLRFAYLKLM